MGMGRIPYFGVAHAWGFDGATRPAGRENPDGSFVWHRDFGIHASTWEGEQ
jgi:hypothetical protein